MYLIRPCPHVFEQVSIKTSLNRFRQVWTSQEITKRKHRVILILSYSNLLTGYIDVVMTIERNKTSKYMNIHKTGRVWKLKSTEIYRNLKKSTDTYRNLTKYYRTLPKSTKVYQSLWSLPKSNEIYWNLPKSSVDFSRFRFSYPPLKTCLCPLGWYYDISGWKLSRQIS